MFVFRKDFEFEAPVAVMTPAGAEQSFVGRFLYVDDRTFDTLAQSDVGLLEKVWIGWGGDIQDEGGRPIAWSAETRGELLGHQYIAQAVAVAYVKARRGMREKN